MKKAGTTTYAINGLGQRVKKNNGTDIFFAYDEAGHLIGEYDATGAPIQETVWLGDLPVAVIKPNGATFDVFYIWTDNLGTPREITDAANQERWEWPNADPFGNNQPNENPTGLGVFSYNLRFPGQYYDAEKGSNYNYFRDYDPSIGRYVESDPLGLIASIDTFGYSGSNPLIWRDSFGLAACAAGDVMCDIAMRQAGLPVPTPCPCARMPHINPVKAAVAMGNAAVAGISAASGGLKFAVASGLAPTGVGSLPAGALFGWSAWNMRSSVAAWNRSRQQWAEAMRENWCAANWKNLYGLFPGGTHYDDPNEPSGPWSYIKTKGLWHYLSEFGYL